MSDNRPQSQSASNQSIFDTSSWGDGRFGSPLGVTSLQATQQMADVYTTRMRSYSGRSIRHMTGVASSPSAVSASVDGDVGRLGRSVASGRFNAEGATITRRHGTPQDSCCVDEGGIGIEAAGSKFRNGEGEDHDIKGHDDGEGCEEEAIVFPQSTHSWLFTENVLSVPFWFAVGIAFLSYFCLILALADFFQDFEEDNPFGVPYQVCYFTAACTYLFPFICEVC